METKDKCKFKDKNMKPPSSYGSMESDSDGEEHGRDTESSIPVFLGAPEAPTSPLNTGLQMNRPESPKTIITVTSHQTKPFGAVVIDTRSLPEEEGDDMVEDMVTHSPEPPEPLEGEASVQTQEGSPFDRLHPEQSLSHIFKSIQAVLSGLSQTELFSFKMCLINAKKDKSLQQVIKGDVLDFVDKMLEVFGQDNSLIYTIDTLRSIQKKAEAEELRNRCERALMRFYLKQRLIQKHGVIHEGVPRHGKQNPLNAIYVAPQISTRGCGGVDPSHELRAPLPSPFHVATADTFVDLNDLFRLKNRDGRPVRTVVTTGIPGIGLTVSVGKFCLDWAQSCANKDLQFVIKLSFHQLWCLRNIHPQEMSMMEVIQYYHPEYTGMKYLGEKDCRFLIIMDSFDCYLAPLDWENSPVVSDISTPADMDVLMVNIIRGSLFGDGCLWILGRRAAVSQIPSQFLDVVTEIQGFSDEMKDEYLTKRFSDARLAAKIVAHYKRLPSLRILARQPVVCWMVATLFKFCFQSHSYGVHPPRLTPFYINILIFQTNRSLELYQKPQNNKMWSTEIKLVLKKMGKLAFNLLQRNSHVFLEEDLRECELNFLEAAVFSGMCTELPPASPGGRRRFCYVHATLQEFMAALYVFVVFCSESKNVLESGSQHTFTSTAQTKSALTLLRSALERTLSAPPGHYDMFLRFLCGLLSPHCHGKLLGGLLFPHDAAAQVSGLDEVEKLLQQTIQIARRSSTDRLENLKECLREMTQPDE